MKKLRIAHVVESFFPSVGGMQEVVRQLSVRMAAQGHEVTVVTKVHPERLSDEIDGVKVRSFDLSGNAVTGIIGDVTGYTDYLLSESSAFDVMVFFAAQQWATDLALPLLDQIATRKVFVPTGFSLLWHENYQDYYRQMKQWILRMDHCVFLSYDYRDIQFAKEAGVVRWSVIPNGAAEEEFESDQDPTLRRSLHIPEDHFLVLHVGSFVASKGQLEALDIFLRSGIRGATLLLVGNKRENFVSLLRRKPFLWFRYQLVRRSKSRRVICTTLNRAFTVAAYRESDLFLFPSKIECSPVVLFEALASRTPFLASDAGNSAEIVQWTEGGWIMPSVQHPDGFCSVRINESAQMLRSIYLNPMLRSEAAEKGYHAWKNQFTWSTIAESYLNLYSHLIEAHDRSEPDGRVG